MEQVAPFPMTEQSLPKTEKKKKSKKSKKRQTASAADPNNPAHSFHDQLQSPSAQDADAFPPKFQSEDFLMSPIQGDRSSEKKKKKKKNKSSDKKERKKEKRRSDRNSDILSPGQNFLQEQNPSQFGSFAVTNSTTTASTDPLTAFSDEPLSTATGALSFSDLAKASPAAKVSPFEQFGDPHYDDPLQGLGQHPAPELEEDEDEDDEFGSPSQFDESQEFSVAESEISDITFGTFHEQAHEMFNNPAFVNSFAQKLAPQQQQAPVAAAAAPPKPPPPPAGRKAPPRGGPMRARSKRASRPMRSSGMSSAFMEKAAILEDYDYDQAEDEFEEEEEKEEEVEEPPPAAAVSRPSAASAPVPSRARLEKWEMLSDDFDEAAFGQAIGHLRRTPSQASRQKQPPQQRHSAPAAPNMGGFMAGMPASGGNDGGKDKNHELLVMYLKSMGADAESAEKIAKSFNNQQENGAGAAANPLIAAVSDEMNSKQATIAAIPGEEPIDDPVGRKMRMLSSPAVQGRNPRQPMYSRSERPGAVVMESRAFGAPRRPPSLTPPPEAAQATEDLYESSAMPALEAELVEAKALSLDPESGMGISDGIDANIVYAESTPLSFKSLFRERRFRRIFFLIAFIFVAVIVISLSVTLTRAAPSTPVVETGAPSAAPSSQPTRIEDDYLNALAPISGWETLLTPGTPQREAVSWLSTFDQISIETSDNRFLQRYALLVLFFSTGGDRTWLETENWLDTTASECDWSPTATTIVCEVDPSRRKMVTAIDLSRIGLEGTVPSEIGLLSQLTSLKMSKNSLNGTIPVEVFSMSRLKTLELSSNQFTGTIAAGISGAADLAHLDLSFNEISGSLPAEFYELRSLFWLDLSSNAITGEITRDIGKLNRLTSINVRHNFISGTIPTSFDEVPKLDFILLDHNLLTGGLPPWSGALVTRQELSISHNQLVGTIPGAESLGAIGGDFLSSIRLQLVDMAYNQFYGTVPPLIAVVPSLRHFDFSGNDFSGAFPNGPGMWSGMEHLGARRNRFSGPYPAFFSPSMKYLDFSDNEHEGGVPSEIANIAELEYLDLSNNALGSSIPEAIGEMARLRIFKARNCSISGTIPKGLTTRAAEFFDFGENQLTGSIYTEFGNVRSLEKLGLDNNQLVGSIPAELASLDLLSILSLDNNELTGTVPKEFGQLRNLKNFTVANNSIIGSIPEGVCTLLPELGIDEVGCQIRCSCCDGWAEGCGISPN